MPKPDKQQRHKAKRNAKRAAKRRRDSVSPVKRLADANGTIECWMSESFEVHGQAQLFAYKEAGSLNGIASFLIDRGVVGLKDAWTGTTIGRAEFADMLAACDRQNLPMRRVSLEDLRRWIAAAARWAHDNGMRLPKDWLKTASLIGGVGAWETADVSAFVKKFAGHPDDLHQRLIGEPFNTYIQRADIDFDFTEDSPYMDQTTGEYIHPDSFDDLDDSDDSDDSDGEDGESILDILPVGGPNKLLTQFRPTAAGLTIETTAWLADRNEKVSPPDLLEAWQSILLATILSKSDMPDGTDEDVQLLGYDLLEDLGGRNDRSRATQYDHAVTQALNHCQTDTKMMQNAFLKYGFADNQQADPF